MGYWHTDAEGHSLLPEPTGMVWGDTPADVMGNAIDEVVDAFQRDLGRPPTKAELEAGFKFSLAVYEDG